MIFCVEDDKNIRELVVYTLNTTGLITHGFENAKEFWNALSEKRPRLILLDIMLPGEDGIQILNKLKTTDKYKDIPVIMVTAKGTEYDKVKGLDSGADDYVTKPFGMLELVSRIKAVLRRTERTKKQAITLGCLSIHVDKHEVKVNDTPVVLTLKEYEMLCKLVQNPDTVFTRERLLEEIWGYEAEVETRTIDVHVRTLRQKLGEAGDLVETVRGVGYRLGGQYEA